ncbi:MAG: penicillin-binding protein activator [Gammaproteobacteria bacterium]|nr:penicillin-binding protein activator [Gammaproteobacteria bacterium]
MPKPFAFPTRPLLLALLIGLLTACATPVPKPTSAEDRLAQETAQLVQMGQYRAAAERYLAAAATAERLQAIRYRTEAAGLLLQAGDPDAAERLLGDLAASSLPAAERVSLVLVQARIALARHRPDTALALLRELDDLEVENTRVADFHRLRAEAYQMAGNRLESARERVWLDGLLSDPQEQEDNRQAIWESLSGLSDTLLQRLRPAAPDVLGGWMELVELSRLLRQPGVDATTRLQNWQRRYPRHPAEARLDQWLAAPVAAELERVALLLPLSGPLAGPAAAVRDGLLAARFQQAARGERTPELRIYDTGTEPQEAWQQYQLAVAEGASMVIGPLHKESIQALVQSGPLTVPVLALNQIDGDGQPGLYQFGLAPEDEARQVAERARWDGHESALVLMPEGAWAERVYGAFAARWEELGGKVLEVQRFAPQQVDFGDTIQALLNLDDSRNRHRALTRLLGRSLEFEPRRRQDADFVFLLAQGREARQIKPQLRFHRAATLPVYSISTVYAGAADAQRDADLNGIRFCDIPWVLAPQDSRPELREQLDRLWPVEMQRHPRLFALGIDAYELLPYLQPQGLRYFDGTTGTLSLDSQRHLYRELRWAEIHRGRPRLLEAALEATPAWERDPDIPMEGPREPEPVPREEIRDESPATGPAG